ncbi:MAG: hypothetical protein ACRDYA_07835 [Egibacteraceae bacterium]
MALTTLAQIDPDITGPGLGGWYLGIAIGFLVVVVVVVIVASILALAARISEKAQTAIQGLEQVRINTTPLKGVDTTNACGLAILKACQTARGALGG